MVGGCISHSAKHKYKLTYGTEVAKIDEGDMLISLSYK